MTSSRSRIWSLGSGDVSLQGWGWLPHFLDQETFDDAGSLNEQQVGDAVDFLIDGLLLQLSHKYNGNPIGLALPTHVDLEMIHAYTEPAVRGDTSSGATKIARLETGLEIKVPLFLTQGEKVRVSTETRDFSGRA